jgi:hypothetical protein
VEKAKRPRAPISDASDEFDAVDLVDLVDEVDEVDEVDVGGGLAAFPSADRGFEVDRVFAILIFNFQKGRADRSDSPWITEKWAEFLELCTASSPIYLCMCGARLNQRKLRIRTH